MASYHFEDQFEVRRQERIWGDDQTATWLTRKPRQDHFYRRRVMNRDFDQLHSKFWSGQLERILEQGNSLAQRRFEHNRDAGDARCNLLEQFQPFCTHARLQICEAGNVAAWMSQAGN